MYFFQLTAYTLGVLTDMSAKGTNGSRLLMFEVWHY